MIKFRNLLSHTYNEDQAIDIYIFFLTISRVERSFGFCFLPEGHYVQTEDNPFAIVTMAHLKAIETKKDNASRKQWKLGLTKLLYKKATQEKK